MGSGIAAIALAKECLDRNLDFIIIRDERSSASQISSGIINPITGRRYAISWNFDQFLASAIAFYGEDIQKMPLKRYYKPYQANSTIDDDLKGKEKYCFSQDPNWVEVIESYQVKVNNFITNILSTIPENRQIISHFSHNELNVKNAFYYNQFVFDKIIFAEGIAVLENPFFSHLPFLANRGEALVIKIPNFKLDKIVQKGKFICPYEDNFWVGSSFDKVDLNSETKTAKAKIEIQNAIPNLIENRTYKEIRHLGAFRATVPDRRPIIGEHPSISNMYVFNGFGTKGVSLVPFLSKNLLDHIFENKDLMAEIDINRFKNL